MMEELAYHHYWAGHYTTHGSSSNIEAHPHMPHATRHTALRKSCCPTICQHLFPIVFSLSSLSPFLLLHFYFFLLMSTWIWNTIAKKTIYIYTIHISLYMYIYLYVHYKNFPICPRGNSRRRDVVKFFSRAARKFYFNFLDNFSPCCRPFPPPPFPLLYCSLAFLLFIFLLVFRLVVFLICNLN